MAGPKQKTSLGTRLSVNLILKGHSSYVKKKKKIILIQAVRLSMFSDSMLMALCKTDMEKMFSASKWFSSLSVYS